MTTPGGKRALLAADTDRTQDYVFESARLPEIRGASAILIDLNERCAPERIAVLDRTAKPIYVGGGSLLYEVDADKAADIQQALETLYPTETGVATITCVHYELPDSATANAGVPQVPVQEAQLDGLSEFQWKRWMHADRDLANFGAWVRLLGYKLRQRKQQKQCVPFVEALPHAERCRSCRIRPAATIDPHYGDELPRCPECARKNEEGLRFIWRDQFERKLKELHSQDHPNLIEEKAQGGKGKTHQTGLCSQDHPNLIEGYFMQAGQGKATVPLDISVIASACTPRNHNKRGYVAFIYADGDGVGSFVESRRTREQYTKVSRVLQDAVWYAVTFALAKNLPIQKVVNPVASTEEENRQPRPTQLFEIVIVGGDDVALIVPAHEAFKVVRDMAEKFAEFLEAKGIRGEKRPLTLSAGVVIAPEHMPVRLMRDFARELLKHGAKPRARETGYATVDFQVFTSTAIYGTDIMKLRSQAPYAIQPPDMPDDRDKQLRLFHRPYTTPELDRLVAALDKLNQEDFPTSQLHALAAALERGRQRATLFYLYQRSRLGKKHREALEAVEAIIPAQEKEDPAPWYKAREPVASYAFSATLRDVAELYDFVPELESKKEVPA